MIRNSFQLNLTDVKQLGENTKQAINISWMMMATTLVFIMQVCSGQISNNFNRYGRKRLFQLFK